MAGRWGWVEGGVGGEGVSEGVLAWLMGGQVCGGQLAGAMEVHAAGRHDLLQDLPEASTDSGRDLDRVGAGERFCGTRTSPAAWWAKNLF